MVFSAIPQILPRPQDVAGGAFLLTAPKILWYARSSETGAGDHKGTSLPARSDFGYLITFHTRHIITGQKVGYFQQ
jgi:hypothetical protein